VNYEEARQHVGDAVIYRPRTDVPGMHGVIKSMKQMPLVHFDDGSQLQVNPFCLELAEPQQGTLL
jgi:hypothetical protein